MPTQEPTTISHEKFDTQFCKFCDICIFFAEFSRKLLIFQTDFLRKFWDCSGAKGCKSCRAWKCCRTHIFLQNFVLIRPRTSPPKICKIFEKCIFEKCIFEKSVPSERRTPGSAPGRPGGRRSRPCTSRRQWRGRSGSSRSWPARATDFHEYDAEMHVVGFTI